MSINSLPVELILNILHRIKDPRTIINFVSAVTLARNVFVAYRCDSEIDHGFFGITQEIQKIAAACYAAEKEKPATLGPAKFKDFMDRHVFVDKSLRTGIESVPIEALPLLLSYHDAVEILVPFFHTQVPSSTLTNSLRNSEIHRIRRALWRYQLYCNLFYQPGSTAKTEEEALMPAQYAFLSSFQPWELEELETVFDCLYHIVLMSRTINPLATYRASLGLPFLLGKPSGKPAPSWTLSYYGNRNFPRIYTNHYFLPHAFAKLRQRDSTPGYRPRCLPIGPITRRNGVIYHGAEPQPPLWKDIPN